MTTKPKTDYEIIQFADQESFRLWLHENHATVPGVWIKIAKQASGIPSVNRKQALDVALCYGWIDGQTQSVDDTFYLQKFTPRRTRSMWSKINIQLVTALIAEGKMQPAGQAEIDAAKADGRWGAAYDSPSSMTMPDDLAAALAAHPKAKERYDTLNKTNAYAILWQIQTARKPETRTNRIQKIIAMLEQGDERGTM